MAGSTGLEPATSGLTVLAVDRRLSLPFQRLAHSSPHANRRDTLRPITPCYAEWVTVSVTPT